MLPTVKDHRPREGPDILEKGLAPGQHAPQQHLRVITPFQHGMEQKGQQVEAEQKRRQVLFAMTKVVLQPGWRVAKTAFRETALHSLSSSMVLYSRDQLAKQEVWHSGKFSDDSPAGGQRLAVRE